MQKQLVQIILWLLLSLGTAQAQQPDLNQFRQDTIPVDTLADISLDTSDIYQFFSTHPEAESDFADTLLGDYFVQYDPIRRASPDLASLGNLGTAHHPLVFHPLQQQGFSLGIDVFDLYRIRAEDLVYYRTEQAYTLAHFSQGPTQDNVQFGIEFSREFANDLSVSLNYERLNNLGSYTHQKAVNDAFAFGFQYAPPQGRYEVFLTFANNTTIQEDNGGISSQPAVLSDPLTVPVRLDNAESRLASRQYRLDHHYKLRREKDSLRLDKRALVLSHTLEYRSDSYKFYDDNLLTAPAFYGNLQIDNRGLRHFLAFQALNNSFRVRTFRPLPVDSTGVKRQKGLMDIGLSHTFYSFNQEPEESNLQNLFLTANWKVTPFKGLVIDAKGRYGLAANVGDYRLEGGLRLDLKKLGRFRAEVINQLNSPDQIAQKLFVTQQLVWENDFKKTLTTTLAAAYEIPEWQVSVGGRYHLINNLIYYDTEGFARQTGIPISIPQLWVKANLEVWKLHLDNEVILQQPTETEIRVPGLYSTHSFYFEGRLFKEAMLAKFGFDLRLTSDYQPNAYQPLTARFHLQNELTTGWQPILDAFVAFKVRTFRFFFRFENLTPLLTEDYYYLTAFHPINHAQIRFGLAWQFVD